MIEKRLQRKEIGCEKKISCVELSAINPTI
jgi:hypothetical protein